MGRERKLLGRVTFWNVAGLRNKNRDFWEELGELGRSGVVRDMGG